jgi:N-formylglutamate deformylase
MYNELLTYSEAKKYMRYFIDLQNSPIWTVALHDGNHIDGLWRRYIRIKKADRLREEDPYTGLLTQKGTNRLVVRTSRFELDLNRDFENALYLHPDQAWGLEVFNFPIPEERFEAANRAYDLFYAQIHQCIQNTIDQFGYFIIFDLHSYNAKRKGPYEIIDEQVNPQINVGSYYNHPNFTPKVARWIEFAKQFEWEGKPLDIRENIKFKGGYFNQWINQHFGTYGGVLSLEFRKDFMNEWTGELHTQHIQFLHDMLAKSMEII